MNHNRIMVKIGELEKYISELEQYIPEEEKDYLQDNRSKRAVERMLQISIECIIDICALLVNYLKLGPPSDDESIMILLKDKLSSIKIIRNMKAFRNVLVHKYGVINDKLVYRFLKENIEDFETILADFKKALNVK